MNAWTAIPEFDTPRKDHVMTKGTPKHYAASQQRLLDFIDAYRQAQGFPPSYREMAAHLGLKSSCAIGYRIRQLVNAGKLDHEFNQARAIRVRRASRNEVSNKTPRERLEDTATRCQAEGSVLIWYGNPKTGGYTGFDVWAWK